MSSNFRLITGNLASGLVPEDEICKITLFVEKFVLKFVENTKLNFL